MFAVFVVLIERLLGRLMSRSCYPVNGLTWLPLSYGLAILD